MWLCERKTRVLEKIQSITLITTPLQDTCTGCSSCGLLSTATGTLSDGSGDSDYAANSYCVWTIAPTGATSITITFTSFSTEMNYDLVYVHQCSNVNCISPTQLAVLDGSKSSAVSYTSNTGYMQIKFESDGYYNRAGFTASWTSRVIFSALQAHKCVGILEYRHTCSTSSKHWFHLFWRYAAFKILAFGCGAYIYIGMYFYMTFFKYILFTYTHRVLQHLHQRRWGYIKTFGEQLSWMLANQSIVINCYQHSCICSLFTLPK